MTRLKPCLDCGDLSRGTRCPKHASEAERRRTDSRTPRGDRYAAAHQRLRAAWVPEVRTGRVECRRGEQCLRFPDTLIRPGEPWHLGHPDAECPAPIAPEHARCNDSAAGRLSHA